MTDDNLIRLTPSKKTEPSKTEARSQKIGVDQIDQANSKQERVITSITSQKKQGRYNVFIDGKYAFPIDENLLVKHLIRKGMVISPAFQKELEIEDLAQKAYQRSLTYLSYGLRSEKEVRDDLAKHDFADQIDFVIEKLKDQSLIDDREFAKAFVRTQANVTRKGPRNITLDLKKKGIEDLLIEDALGEYPPDQQLENAIYLVNKQSKKPSKASQKEWLQKLKLFLMSKGFAGEIINQAIQKVQPEIDDDQEYENLKKVGLKAWRRYSRKSQGFELKNKTKSFLYSKGFSMDLINRFADELEDEKNFE